MIERLERVLVNSVLLYMFGTDSVSDCVLKDLIWDLRCDANEGK